MPSWPNGESVESNRVEEMLAIQSEARDKARLVRNCPYCRAGWREDKDGNVTRCTCFKDWQQAIATLQIEARKYRKATGDESEWDTSDLHNLHSVSEVVGNDG